MNRSGCRYFGAERTSAAENPAVTADSLQPWPDRSNKSTADIRHTAQTVGGKLDA
jgi:hypothetical protein